MRTVAPWVLLVLFGGSLSAHPFDDRVDPTFEIYLDRDAQTRAESMRLTVLYLYDDFFSGYKELGELDRDKDGRITRHERDERFKTLASDLVNTVKLELRDEPMQLTPLFDRFEFLDLNHEDASVNDPGGMPIRRDTHIGYTFSFSVTPATPWGEGAHPVNMLLADSRILILVPNDQFRVFDDRSGARIPIMKREFYKTPEKFHAMRFLWEVQTHMQGAQPVESAKPQQPRTGERERLIEEAQQRSDTQSTESRIQAAFASLRDNAAGPGVWLAVLALMFVLGAWHAVMPGHGKTLVAAYLIGTQGKKRDALFLGVVVTAAHTSGILLLMAGVWAASEFWPGVLKSPQQQIAQTITLVVGVTILILGFGLVLKRSDGAHHEHDVFGRHVHEGEHDHSHDHTHRHGAVPHSHHDHEHPHGHEPDPAHMSRGEILRLGILGGIIPCPTAYVVGAVAIQQQLYMPGLIAVIVFSLGLAVVLSSIGLILVQTKAYLRQRRQESGSRLYRAVETKLPVFGALVITLIGAAMVLLSLIRMELIDPRTFTV